ncbi:hypothetical protein D3C87_2209800 [compost metagenome]
MVKMMNSITARRPFRPVLARGYAVITVIRMLRRVPAITRNTETPNARQKVVLVKTTL